MSGVGRRTVAWVAVVGLFAGTAGAAPPQPVSVKNTTADPVPVRQVPADEPFHQSLYLSFADGSGMETGSYTVPADKRLVIEYASMVTYLPADGQSLWLWVATTTGNGYNTLEVSHALHVQKREDYGLLKVFNAGHLVRLYSNPGTTVRVTMGRYPYSGMGTGMVILSGRLESLP